MPHTSPPAPPMPTSVAHAPMVCLAREVELLIAQAAGAWRQALECECRGDANAAVAWHVYARDLGERAERLARSGRPPLVEPSTVPPRTPDPAARREGARR